MRIFFALVLVAVLAGCGSSQPAQALDGAAGSESPVAGTLADANNPVEMAAAPVVSRLAIQTFNTAKSLRAEKITKDQAIEFRENGQRWRAQLESAIAANDLSTVQRVAAELDTYLINRDNHERK